MTEKNYGRLRSGARRAVAAIKRFVQRNDPAEFVFKMVTWNLLGWSHTNGRQAKYGHFKSGVIRMALAIKVITRHRGVSVYGFQEFQAQQQKIFRKHFKDKWGFYNVGDNGIMWKRKVWSMLEWRTIEVPYYAGRPKPMPVLLLKHQKTGVVCMFMSVHNPWNEFDGDGSSRRSGWHTQFEVMKNWSERGALPFAFNDANAGPYSFGKIAEEYGVRYTGPEPHLNIDFMFYVMDEAVEIEDHKSIRHDRIREITDHPFVKAKVRVHIKKLRGINVRENRIKRR